MQGHNQHPVVADPSLLYINPPINHHHHYTCSLEGGLVLYVIVEVCRSPGMYHGSGDLLYFIQYMMGSVESRVYMSGFNWIH